MAPPSRMNKESDARAPLSSRMLDLLALIITAIDLRRDIIDVPPEPGYRPQTCEACSGTGHLMVPIPAGEDDDDDESYLNATFDDDGDDDNDNGNAPGPSSRGSGPDAGFGTVGAAPIGVASAGGCSVPDTVYPVDTGAGPSQAGPSNVAGPSNAGGPPAVGNGPPAGAGAVSFAPPAAVVPISGIHPLPPGTPVPPPHQAVYANAGAARYYTVTRGLRVGVFEGWPRVSPFVTGVQRAVYSRHRTLQEAFDAYCVAYANGSVRYA
ncbi:hypothetical protein MD484_g6596, partial [Candolleomyces efflorescens]